MRYTGGWRSPLGGMLLAADELGLTGLWFEGQKYFPRCAEPERELPVFAETRRWLEIYFSGREPDFTPPLHFTGTPFQNAVWEILRGIPYGQTTTYGAIAGRLAGKTRGGVSARAVGGAVGRNPISVIVPCHRVIGANGSLTGYAGGLERKRRLLQLEGARPFPEPECTRQSAL